MVPIVAAEALSNDGAISTIPADTAVEPEKEDEDEDEE